MDPAPDENPDQAPALTKIWRDALDKPGLDEDSDVFENGATSLHVLQVAGQIYQQLGTNVSLRDVFTHTTPRSLATLLYGDPATSTAGTDGSAS